MKLHGHESAVAEFNAAIASGRVHHAWLLGGPRGVGKALFSDLAAKRLLAGTADASPDEQGMSMPADHPTAHLVEAGSHPDFRRLARLPRENSPGELARNISIAQVRELQRLFGSRPSMADWRVVIVDAVDELERSAANALLKNLEEPPARSVFFLVSHNPGRLLPTIRSRCRMLRFSRLDDKIMTSAITSAMPDIAPDELSALVRAGRGAPGEAMRFAGLDVATLDKAITELVASGDVDNAKRSALAEQLSARSAQQRYEMFLLRAPSAIVTHARALRGRSLAEAIILWEEAVALASVAPRLTLDPQSTVFEIAGKLAALAPAR